MKADITDLNANKIGSIELPSQFEEEIRPDLISRAFISIQSSLRQSYGAFEGAGKRQKAKLSRRRRDFKTAYGKGISRAPRKTLSRRGSQFVWVGAFAPGTVKGRRAHPPKPSKIYFKQINKKENRKAIRSALSASLSQEFLKLHGHKFPNLPLIIEEKFESLSKAKEVNNFFLKLGLKEELLRLEDRSIRPGKGKVRGRKYKNKMGPLIIVSKKCPLINAVNNIPGFQAVVVNNINVMLLAPGSKPGRLLIWSKAAVEKLKEDNLFMLNKKVKKEKNPKPIKKKELEKNE